MADTYKPGDTVPKTGKVQCTQHNNTKDHVQAGTTFAPCMHWSEHDRTSCTWEYV
jgi:hypothetical protein